MADISETTMNLIGLGVGLAIVDKVVNNNERNRKHKKKKADKPFKW